MDIRMPGKKGNEVAKRMRTLPQFAHTPIVLMTAYSLSESERKEMMTSDGVDQILNKPLPDFDQLRIILHDLVERKQSDNSTDPTPNEQELSSVIHRINRLGAASERIFSRLYKGLGGAAIPSHLRDQNRQLQNTLTPAQRRNRAAEQHPRQHRSRRDHAG